MKRIWMGVVILLALGLMVHAQAGINGKWEGKTRNGFEVKLDLTATETTLTGTLTREGQSSAIVDGKVSKNTFTFKATLNDQTEGFTGELDQDQLKVWLDRQGPSMAAVFKRVNEVKGAAESKLTGKWQGKTGSGRQVVLDARVDGQHLTGRFTLAEKSAEITEGKVEGTTFSFTAGPLDGRTVTFQGRRVGDQVELTVEDVPSPLTLERVKAATGK